MASPQHGKHAAPSSKPGTRKCRQAKRVQKAAAPATSPAAHSTKQTPLHNAAAAPADQPKKSIVPTIVFALIFIAGLALLLYPAFSNAWNEWRHGQAINNYQEQVSQTSQEDTDHWLALAEAYNKTLEGKGIPDAFAFHAEDENAEYAAQLAFRDDGMMGYLNIPHIKQNLPIYHTTSEEALEKGVGHLQGSALPIGGESTHCVLSAHRGLPSAALFTDLDQLAEGDRFFIHVLDRTMAYQVDQILVVEPTQTESLSITPGEDLVTLVTCTPYGVNTHRLLVRGHRVPYDPADEATADTSQSVFTQYWLWILLGLAAVALVLLALCLLTRKRKKNSDQEAASISGRAAYAKQQKLYNSVLPTTPLQAVRKRKTAKITLPEIYPEGTPRNPQRQTPPARKR